MKELAIILLCALIVGAGIYIGGALPQVAESVSDARIAEAQAQVSIELARVAQAQAFTQMMLTFIVGAIALLLVLALVGLSAVLLRYALEITHREQLFEIFQKAPELRASLPESIDGEFIAYLPVASSGATRTHARARTQKPEILRSYTANKSNR